MMKWLHFVKALILISSICADNEKMRESTTTIPDCSNNCTLSTLRVPTGNKTLPFTSGRIEVPVVLAGDVLEEDTDEYYEDDGMLGIVPELFLEDDDSNLGLYEGDSLQELLSICANATKCEECPQAATNSHSLIEYKGTDKKPPCDVISQYNFHKLRVSQKQIKYKQEFIYSPKLNCVYAVFYGIIVLLGVYLLAVGQFRISTLWDTLAEDPTQGIRSFRYESMEFKFDPADPGADPEDKERYENWELYNSSDDEAKSHHTYKVNIPGKGTIKMAKERENQKARVKGAQIWPWDLPGYNFAQIPYRQGTPKDMDDWRPDENPDV